MGFRPSGQWGAQDSMNSRLILKFGLKEFRKVNKFGIRLLLKGFFGAGRRLSRLGKLAFLNTSRLECSPVPIYQPLFHKTHNSVIIMELYTI